MNLLLLRSYHNLDWGEGEGMTSALRMSITETRLHDIANHVFLEFELSNKLSSMSINESYYNIKRVTI